MFTTTLNPAEVAIRTVDWRFDENTYITYANETSNVTEPAYQGRVSLLPTTGSLELRNVTLSDTGQYKVFILPRDGRILSGSTTLQVYGEQLVKSNDYSSDSRLKRTHQLDKIQTECLYAIIPPEEVNDVFSFTHNGAVPLFFSFLQQRRDSFFHISLQPLSPTRC